MKERRGRNAASSALDFTTLMSQKEFIGKLIPESLVTSSDHEPSPTVALRGQIPAAAQKTHTSNSFITHGLQKHNTSV